MSTLPSFMGGGGMHIETAPASDLISATSGGPIRCSDEWHPRKPVHSESDTGLQPAETRPARPETAITRASVEIFIVKLLSDRPAEGRPSPPWVGSETHQTRLVEPCPAVSYRWVNEANVGLK